MIEPLIPRCTSPAARCEAQIEACDALLRKPRRRLRDLPAPLLGANGEGRCT